MINATTTTERIVMDTKQTEIVRTTEHELMNTIAGGDVFKPAKLPYHYPPCSTGTCAGCDAQADRDATATLRSAS